MYFLELYALQTAEGGLGAVSRKNASFTQKLGFFLTNQEVAAMVSGCCLHCCWLPGCWLLAADLLTQKTSIGNFTNLIHQFGKGRQIGIQKGKDNFFLKIQIEPNAESNNFKRINDAKKT